MTGDTAPTAARLLVAGREVYECMWASVAAAHTVVRIETYIWKPGAVADRFLQELHAAMARGVRVELLLDAFGSAGLPTGYFSALKSGGARLVWFNQRRLFQQTFRNHRKLMTVDGAVAILGGLNIADEYAGDGIALGWRDFAVELRGDIVAALDTSMDHMMGLADFRLRTLRRFARFYRRRRWRRHPVTAAGSADLLLSGPGTHSVRMQRALRKDLAVAHEVTAYAAYLIPTARMRRAIRAVAVRGGRVRMITGARTDVPMMGWAAQHLYPFWLRGGVELYEYLPQVVHAKLLAIDDIVYVGSANLDIRSLRINYEVLVRIPSAPLAVQVRRAFDDDLTRSQRIDLDAWRAQRRRWHGLRSLWAFLLVARLDPYLAWRGLRGLS